MPTVAQEAKQKTIQTEIDRLEEQLKPTHPRSPAQAVWEQAMRLEPSARWTVLMPKSLEAEM